MVSKIAKLGLESMTGRPYLFDFFFFLGYFIKVILTGKVIWFNIDHALPS